MTNYKLEVWTIDKNTQDRIGFQWEFESEFSKETIQNRLKKELTKEKLGL